MTEKTTRIKGNMIQRRLIPSYIVLVIVSFFSVFPIYWMITAATNNTVDVARGKIFFGSEAAVNFDKLLKGTNLWPSKHQSGGERAGQVNENRG